MWLLCFVSLYLLDMTDLITSATTLANNPRNESNQWRRPSCFDDIPEEVKILRRSGLFLTVIWCFTMSSYDCDTEVIMTSSGRMWPPTSSATLVTLLTRWCQKNHLLRVKPCAASSCGRVAEFAGVSYLLSTRSFCPSEEENGEPVGRNSATSHPNTSIGNPRLV